jgi:hypothetical protein
MIKYFNLSFIVLTFSFSTHCLAHDEVRGLDDMKRINGDRCAAYNSDSSEVRVGEIEKTKDGAIADYTDSINTFLTNKKNVNPKRHATEDQQRDILQSLMATAIIYGSTTTYANHGLSEGDALFWHFEILRVAEVLSFKYVESIKDYKNTSRDYLKERQLEYDLLAKHGGITSDMFDIWFCEELAKHGGGFFNAANQGPWLPGPKEFNFTLYIQNNGERISSTVASGLECDLHTKKDTPFKHNFVQKKKYERVVEEIKRGITTISRGRGELPTRRKLKGLDEDDAIQITEHAGCEILETEIMKTYMWTEHELRDSYKNTKLRAGSTDKFRSRSPKEAGSGKSRIQFRKPQELKKFLEAKDTVQNKMQTQFAELGEEIISDDKTLARLEQISLLCNTLDNRSLVHINPSDADAAYAVAFEGYQEAMAKKRREEKERVEKANKEKERLAQLDAENKAKRQEELANGTAWTCSMCKQNNLITLSTCRSCFTKKT